MFIDSELRIVQSEHVDDIKEQIVAKASGVFLWVALVAPILNKAYDRGKTRELVKKLNELPPRLGDLFRDIPLRDSRNREALLLCLQWVLFAKAPMELEVLYFAIGEDAGDNDFFWNHEELSTEDLRLHLLDTSKGLIEETKSKSPTMQFIHESVRDFLLKQNGLKQLWPNLGDNYEAESHGSLAKRCLQHVNTNIARRLQFPNPLPETPSESEKLQDDIRLAFPFMEYAIMGILHHSNAAQALGISQLEFIQQFPLGAWMACYNAIVKHRNRRHPSDTSLLYIPAEHDLASLVLIHPDRLQHHQIQGGRYRYPLLAALACGSRQVSQDLGLQVFLDQEILITKDPEYEAYFNSLKPNRSFRIRATTLLAGVLAFDCPPACEALFVLGAGSHKIDGPEQSVLTQVKGPNVAEAFIRHGVDPNKKNADRNPIVLGPQLKGGNIYKTLLQYGLERTATDAAGRTLFSYAAEDRNASCFEDMPGDFDFKVMNILDIQGLTPIAYAAKAGSFAVLKLLCGMEDINLDLADHEGRTPLSHAAENYDDLTRLLLQ
ncbi:PFS domain-containing protein [Seiridium cupressi]